MLDSKQLALVYLMEESNKLASLCTKNVHILHKKKTTNDISEQMGRVFVAMKEVVQELKIDEQQLEGYVFEEEDRRNKER